MPKFRIIIKTSIGERVLLSVEQAKDQSIYFSHGYKSNKATAYGGSHTFDDAREIEKNLNFREHKTLDLPSNFKGCHTGVKNSGVVLDKWDYENNKQYLKSVVSSDQSNSVPVLIEQVIPGRYDKYLERKSERKRDYIFPSVKETIDEITNFQGFRFEIWLRESHVNSDLMLCRDGIIYGIDIRLGTKILSLLLVQDTNDISRGLMDNMLILRMKSLEKES